MCGTVGAVRLVDRDAPARVGLEAGPVEVQVRGVALAADGVEHGLGDQLLARLQEHARAARVDVEVHAGDRLAQPERDVAAPEEVLEGLADLAVEEVEHAVALVDHRDLRPERAEHRRVLDADHAGADDDHRARHVVLELEQAVRVDHGPVVEVDGLRARRMGARGDHDPVRPDRLVVALHLHGVGVDEVRLAGQQADPVAPELLAHDGGLGRDHARGAIHQLLEHRLLGLLDPRGIEHVERALGELLEHRLAQRLGGDRAGVDGDAAEPLLALGDGDALAQLGGLDRGLLAARPGPDDE